MWTGALVGLAFRYGALVDLFPHGRYLQVEDRADRSEGEPADEG